MGGGRIPWKASRLAWTAAAALVLAVGVAAAPAFAVTKTLRFGAPFPAEFEVKGTNGFSVDVFGSGDTVMMNAIGRHGMVSYRVHGIVTTNRLKARFGSLGKVDVRFRPSGKVKPEAMPKGCAGKPGTTSSGLFVGTIEFAGENGYTRVDARRARGTTSVAPHLKCKPGYGEDPSATIPKAESFPTMLVASTPHDRVFFMAEVAAGREGQGTGLSMFAGGVTEQRGSLHVERIALAIGLGSSFTFDQALSVATVSPPGPFAGTATFQRNPDGSIGWSGDLTMSPPGADPMPLTGPAFTATLGTPKTEAEFIGMFALER